jgi:hypothetical protein
MVSRMNIRLQQACKSQEEAKTILFKEKQMRAVGVVSDGRHIINNILIKYQII